MVVERIRDESRLMLSDTCYLACVFRAICILSACELVLVELPIVPVRFVPFFSQKRVLFKQQLHATFLRCSGVLLRVSRIQMLDASSKLLDGSFKQ